MLGPQTTPKGTSAFQPRSGTAPSTSPFTIARTYRTVHELGLRVVLNEQGADEVLDGYVGRPTFYRHILDARTPTPRTIRTLPGSLQSPGLYPCVLALQSAGHATEVDGGWMLHDTWPFVSRADHAHWALPCTTTGSEQRLLLVPSAAWTVTDTGDTPGLRATASHAITAEKSSGSQAGAAGGSTSSPTSASPGNPAPFTWPPIRTRLSRT
ncbi:hypothetical protein [Streptomyces syringium]|uniref:hypothetical protein n=1 Tax=Streptomyces syringium TaxID=76729 RepID=UPI0033D6CE2D